MFYFRIGVVVRYFLGVKIISSYVYKIGFWNLLGIFIKILIFWVRGGNYILGRLLFSEKI